ncbi:uncharacterized protein RHO25_002731 [Cercospora beticola]|uniref:Uncharacterized protein n=1 Tax=Cercospora beticola TaxID=122368 RepID=A0ABZ0NF19_CERBT|nr:hypothetical protein RHO25_002731 [Cercospora beticola]
MAQHLQHSSTLNKEATWKRMNAAAKASSNPGAPIRFAKTTDANSAYAGKTWTWDPKKGNSPPEGFFR